MLFLALFSSLFIFFFFYIDFTMGRISLIFFPIAAFLFGDE